MYGSPSASGSGSGSGRHILRPRRRNGGLSRRRVHQVDNHHERNHRFSSSSDSSHESSRQRVTKSEWFDSSPISIGDSIPSSGGLSLEDFGPLPFDADGNHLPHASSSFCRSDNTSVCESICSDQAVIYPCAAEEEVRSSSSFHSDATTTVSSHSTTILETPRREEEDDSFDPDAAMRAPPTDTMHWQPHHHFHRISQHASLPGYMLGQEGKPIDMTEESSRMSAQLAVASLLREFDAAFIRRSDGKWTYAILAEKVRGKKDAGDDVGRGLESSKLRFVVDVNGSTKNFSFHKWGACVRLVRDPMEANALLLSKPKRGHCGKVVSGDRKKESRVVSEVKLSFGDRLGKL